MPAPTPIPPPQAAEMLPTKAHSRKEGASATAVPLSAGRMANAICSSVNRFLFIVRSSGSRTAVYRMDLSNPM